LDFIAENPTNTIGYIGLSQNSGRIILIEPQAYGPVCLLERYILAHTGNVDFVSVYDSLVSERFSMVISKKDLHLQYEHILED